MKKNILVVILIIIAGFGVYGQNSTPIDLILLLDTSSGMASSYETVNNYLTGAFLSEFLRVGDTFHLIAFSGTPRMDVARRITGRGDIETIIGRMLIQYPVENGSDVRAAISFAEGYAASLPSRPKKIVMIGTGSPEINSLVTGARQRLSLKNTSFDFVSVTPGLPLANLPTSGRTPAQRQTATPSTAQTRPSSPSPAAGSSTAQTPAAGAASPATQTQPSSPSPAAGSSTAQTPASSPAAGAASPATQTQPSSPSPATGSSTAQTPASSPSAGAASPTTQTQPTASSGTPPATAAATPDSGESAPSQPATAVSDSGTQAQGDPQGGLQGGLQSDQGLQDTSTSTDSTGAGESARPQTVVSVPGEAAETETNAEPSAVKQTAAKKQKTAWKPWDSSVVLSIVIVILVLLVIGLIIFFVSRKLGSSPSRVIASASSSEPATGKKDEPAPFVDHSKELATYAAVQTKQRTTPYKDRPVKTESVKPPVINPSGPLLLNLFVEDQNTAIGKRNIHSLKSGYSLTVGGGKSDFLIFLVPMPSNIGEIRRNGGQCNFVPKKSKYFPDLGSNELMDCINKTVRVLSDKNYELRFRFEMYEDPLVELNRILHSVKVPG